MLPNAETLALTLIFGMTMALDFTNTEIAFRSKSDEDLQRAKWLFRAVQYPWLVRTGAPLAEMAMKFGLPVKPLLEHTMFRHFCGGETIEASTPTIADLARFNVGTILDYSVEGLESEAGFDATLEELIKGIVFAEGRREVPFSVFKLSGIARHGLLSKKQRKESLSTTEVSEWDRVHARFRRLTAEAAKRQVRLFVDSEDAAIQDIVDTLTREAMAECNREHPVIYGTLQLYRRDRPAFLEEERRRARDGGYVLAFKLVRGAYLEGERQAAEAAGVPSPLWSSKEETDAAYDRALVTCVQAVASGERLALCAGTHNEESNALLAKQVDELKLSHDDPRIYTAQLLGMSDHLTFNLAAAGFNAAKYVPYGPVELVFPYLVRRAQENSAVAGQTGRELLRIEAELKRRRESRAGGGVSRSIV